MTNKAQTTLTIALTFAVSVLMVDRIIEPAQAQNCATNLDVQFEASTVVRRVLECIDGSKVNENGYIRVDCKG